MDEPRYIVRELRGFRIPTRDDLRASMQTTTFMVLDSFYCYEVVFQIESSSGGNLGVADLRKRVGSYCERLNAGPIVCACDGCDVELPILFSRPKGLWRQKYCCHLHEWRQSERNRRASRQVAV